MRLLVLTQYYWPETFPITAEVRRLRDKGIDVTVLTGKPNYPAGAVFPGYRFWDIRRERHDGIEIIRIPLVPRGNSSAFRLVVNYASFILAGLLLGPIVLRGRRFDAVLVYAPSPLLQAIPAIAIARLKRAALLVWVQDLWPESLSATGAVSNRRVLAAVAWVVRRIYRSCDLILAPSRGFFGPIEDISGDPTRLRYVPNPVPVTRQLQRPEPDVTDLAARIGERFSVVFAGNFGRAQALDVVLAAAEQLRDLPQVRLVLIGSGRIGDDLRSEVRRRRIDNVDMPGRFPAETMPTLLAQAGALLLTLRDEAIFSRTVPSKLQIYLATGRPIIAALKGEGARIVEEAGAGLVCAPGDATALAEAIRTMAQADVHHRAEMGKAALAYFEANFAPEIVTNGLAGHIEEAIEMRTRTQRG